MNILLLSAYDAQSHKRWRIGLVSQFAKYQWTVLSLPPRFFSWRLRGNAYSWFMRNRSELEQNYDLIIATSMVELSALRSLLPSIANIPTILYFHENQFAYPLQRKEQQRELMHFRLSSIYSAISATTLLFNSEYNRRSFLEGVRFFLRSMPDFAPKSIVEELSNKASVLPVPLEDELFERKDIPLTLSSPDELLLVWNHRWEYDKGPEILLKTLELCKINSIPFKIAVLGQQFSNSPSCFQEIKKKYSADLLYFGYLPEKEDYLNMVQACDIILSTALHEFQGLAILEAIALGLTPVAPNRLAYPEFVPPELLYPSFPDDIQKDATELCKLLMSIAQNKKTRLSYSVDVSHLSWSSLRPHYQNIIEEIAARTIF